MESTRGCQSYRFYHNEVGAPRCALYGAPVALSIYDLDETLDDLWFDLSCGSPSQETWHTQMPVEHDDKDEQKQRHQHEHEQETAGSSSSSHSQASANGESNKVLNQGGAVSGQHNSLVNIGISG
jgi:hypothetical protein